MANNETHDKHSFQGDLGLATKSMYCVATEQAHGRAVGALLASYHRLAEETGPSGVFSQWFKR